MDTAFRFEHGWRPMKFGPGVRSPEGWVVVAWFTHEGERLYGYVARKRVDTTEGRRTWEFRAMLTHELVRVVPSAEVTELMRRDCEASLTHGMEVADA